MTKPKNITIDGVEYAPVNLPEPVQTDHLTWYSRKDSTGDSFSIVPSTMYSDRVILVADGIPFLKAHDLFAAALAFVRAGTVLVDNAETSPPAHVLAASALHLEELAKYREIEQ